MFPCILSILKECWCLFKTAMHVESCLICCHLKSLCLCLICVVFDYCPGRFFAACHFTELFAFNQYTLPLSFSEEMTQPAGLTPGTQPNLQKVNLRQPRHMFPRPMPALPGTRAIMQGESLLKLHALSSNSETIIMQVVSLSVF